MAKPVASPTRGRRQADAPDAAEKKWTMEIRILLFNEDT